jgi:hypothetical protein
VTTIAPPPPAPPAPVTAPPLPPGRRSAVRVLVVVAASILVLAYVATLGVAAWRLNALRMSIESKDLPAGMRSLTIDAADANVRVKVDPQAGAPHVDLRMVDSTRDDRERMEITSDSDGTRILLSPDSPSFMDWGRSGEVTVTLPPQLARGLSVTTQQDDGRVIVDADVDQLTADSLDGDIVLNGGARRIDITSGDGDVVAKKPISVTESFNAHTVDGDVLVEFKGAAPRTVEAISRDGDIAIALPGPGPYLVDSSADSRSIRVPETTDPARAAAKVTVRTVDGDVLIDTSGAARSGRR